jgi:hypothetical protein
LKNPPNPLYKGEITLLPEKVESIKFPFEKIENIEFPLIKAESIEFPLVKGVRGIFECKDQNCYSNREPCRRS